MSTLVLNRPWTITGFNGFGTTNSSGTIVDHIYDNRSATVHTPKAKWRPPTAYNRSVTGGFTESYTATVAANWHVTGYPPETRGNLTCTGARSANGSYWVAIPAVPSNLEARAIIKARLKLKNQMINLAQNLGERKQTARLVGDTCVRLAGMVRNLRRLKPGRAIRLNKADFFDLWLELQYGWKPLLSDVHGAVSALHEREKERGLEITTVKALVTSSDYQVTTLHDSFNVVAYDFDRTRKVKHKCFVRLDFIPDENPLLLRTLSQLGITNPLSLAWELLPFSFVADWFVPIGDYLDSLDATVGWTFKGGSVSKVTRVQVAASNPRVTNVPTSYDPNDRTIRVTAEGSGYQMSFVRSVYTSAPLPRMPSFGKLDKASHDHVANGIALLSSAIRHKGLPTINGAYTD